MAPDVNKLWRRHLPLPSSTRINWVFCARWINFGSGIRWTTNVTVWFAARLLLASKFRWRAVPGETVRCGLAVPQTVVIRSRWIWVLPTMKCLREWKCWQLKNIGLRHRYPLIAAECPTDGTKRITVLRYSCGISRRTSTVALEGLSHFESSS